MLFHALLLVVLSTLLSLSALAAPIQHGLTRRSPAHDLHDKGAIAKNTSNEKRDSSGPHFTYYADRWEGTGAPPDPSEIPGWNVFALSFWLSNGAADMAAGWAALPADQKTQVKSSYAAAGIKLIVAAFGSTEFPVTSGEDPTTVAQTLAQFVKDNQLDGVDVDFEDTTAMNAGTAESWLVTFTNALRGELPAGQYIISHAPVAPWFTDSTAAYPGGGYLKVNQEAGDAIDFYNIQFYNQGSDAYTTCDSLITTSNLAPFPHTALLEIIASGVDGSKLLIGKPGNTGDASNGYIDQTTFQQCVSQAQAQGWNGGLMIWEYPDVPSGFVSSVWGSGAGSGSGGGGGGGGATTTTATPPPTTATSAQVTTPPPTSVPTTTPVPTTSVPSTTTGGSGSGSGSGSTYVQCTSSTTWSLCSSDGQCTPMGSVPGGTTCQDTGDGATFVSQSVRATKMRKARTFGRATPGVQGIVL